MLYNLSIYACSLWIFTDACIIAFFESKMIIFTPSCGYTLIWLAKIVSNCLCSGLVSIKKFFFSEITNIRMFLLSLILPGSDRRWYKVMHCLTHTFAVFLYWLISSLLPVVVLIFYLSFMKWLFFLSSYLDVCTNKNNFPFCYTSISFYYSLSAYFSVRTYKYGTFVIYTECNCKIVQIV